MLHKGYTLGFENLSIKLDELEEKVIYEFKDYFIDAKQILLKISYDLDSYEVKRVINYIKNSISEECTFDVESTQKTSLDNILVSLKISSLNKHPAPSEFEIDSISKSFYTEIIKDDNNFTVKLSPKENQHINLAVISLTNIDNLSIKYDDIFIDNFTKIYSCSTQHLKNIILIYLSDLLIYHFYLPLAHKHNAVYSFTKDITQYEKIVVLQNSLKSCNE